jgi:aminoglycoside N3'-acetyltransferase
MMIGAILDEVATRMDARTIARPFFSYVISDAVIGAISGRIDRIDPATMASEIFSELELRNGKYFARKEGTEFERLTLLHQYEGDFNALDL